MRILTDLFHFILAIGLTILEAMMALKTFGII